MSDSETKGPDAKKSDAILTSIFSMLDTLEDEHCTCDLMRGYGCDIHEKVRNVRDALEPFSTLADLYTQSQRELEQAQREIAEVKRERDLLVQTLNYSEHKAAKELFVLKNELSKRKGDPTTRLHNLCAALEADRDGSEFSREEWDRIDAENVSLTHERDRYWEALVRAETKIMEEQYRSAREIIDQALNPSTTKAVGE